MVFWCIFTIEFNYKPLKFKIMNYKITTNHHTPTNKTTFVEFSDGKTSYYNLKEIRKGSIKETILISSNELHDKAKWSVGLNEFGAIEVVKVSTKKVTKTVNHQKFGKCKVLENNGEGMIKIKTEAGEVKMVIEKFFMNGVK